MDDIMADAREVADRNEVELYRENDFLALASRLHLGARETSPEVQKAVVLLMDQLPRFADDLEHHDVYYWFHATRALRLVGGKPWNEWSRALGTALLAYQQTQGPHAGSWDPDLDPWGTLGGRVYLTSIATLVPN